MLNKKFRNGLMSLLVLAMSFVISPLQAQTFMEGTDFVTISAEGHVGNDGKVEVLEFFWFGCPSCYRFEPTLLAWNVPDYINFENIPAAFVDNWEFHAHAYFAMELLGLKDELMQKFYDVLHVERKRINDAESFQEWAATQDGVDAEKLTNTLHSFATITKVKQAAILARKYGVNSVPTMVVGRKYRTSPSMAGSDQRALEIVEYLAQRILSEEGA